MKYHLDTAFLVDVQNRLPATAAIAEEIVAARHQVSIDPIVYTEFTAAPYFSRRKELTLRAFVETSTWLPITREACNLAARWLAPMDSSQRRARFNDALIAATASLHGATLVTNDGAIGSTFSVAVLTY